MKVIAFNGSPRKEGNTNEKPGQEHSLVAEKDTCLK